ncbi:MAG: hypothetical protein ACRDMH_16015 [Solirubrobacterales bacterium]
MNRLLLWITTAVLGAAAALITGIGGLLAGLLLLVLAVPLVLRGAHAVALSGLMTGFGTLWSFAMAQQPVTGGVLHDAEFWWAVGIVPLVIGGSLLVLVATRSLRRRVARPS